MRTSSSALLRAAARRRFDRGDGGSGSAGLTAGSPVAITWRHRLVRRDLPCAFIPPKILVRER